MVWSFCAGNVDISLHKEEIQHILESFLHINTYLDIYQHVWVFKENHSVSTIEIFVSI